MALSPLKFSLIVSVAVHGLAIGGAMWLGKFHRTAAVVEVGDMTTLELVAAPASAIESVTTKPPAPAPTPSAVTPPPIAPPPEEIISQRTAPVPLPSPVETVVEPMTTIPSTAPTITPVPANISGDSSSPLPGKDYTTVVGNSVTLAAPNALNQTEPEYPLAARRRGQEGTVLVKVTVNVQGEAETVVVLESSGYELLDQAAIRFARTWKFTPARIGTTPVESNVERPVRFKLNR